MYAGGHQLDTGTYATPDPEIPADVVRTCPAPMSLGEVRVGMLLRYQTESMATEMTDRVVRVGERCVELAGGRQLWGGDWFVEAEEGENVQRSTLNVQHPMGEMGMEEGENVQRPTSNSQLPMGDGENSGLGTSNSELKGRTMGSKTYNEEHWRKFAGLVIALVDGEGKTVKDAVAQANADMGCEHAATSLNTKMRSLGMAWTTDRATLISRARSQAHRTRRASGRTRHAVSKPKGGEDGGATPGGIAQDALVAATAKAARQIASTVEAEIREARMPGTAEERIAALVADGGLNDETARAVSRQAGHLVAAYLRGRHDAPAAVPGEADAALVAEVLTRVCERLRKGLVARAEAVVDAGRLIVREVGA